MSEIGRFARIILNWILGKEVVKCIESVQDLVSAELNSLLSYLTVGYNNYVIILGTCKRPRVEPRVEFLRLSRFRL